MVPPMKFQQLRNATALLTLGEHRLLIDPMLSEPGALPAFRLYGARKRNPLVPLPSGSTGVLQQATGVLITHEHPDHFDRPALQWVRSRGLPVWANTRDIPSLKRKGLDVHALTDGALGMRVEVVPSRHGRGLQGWLMGPVAGYFLAHRDEPSVYLTGDAILTESVLDAVERLQPEVIVAPAGAANFGLGDILFSVDELEALVRRAPNVVVLNHLEALDHCPTSREALRERMRRAGLLPRVRIPEDGDVVSIERSSKPASINPRKISLKPGFQKWLTAKFAGT